jgi:hypothetical protein
MSLLEQSLRAVDPVDPDAPMPDGEALLREIVGTPVRPARRSGRRRLRGRVALAAAVAAAVAGVLLAMPGRDDVDVLAAAFEAVSQPDTILHYRIEQSVSDPIGAHQPMDETEVWQAGDGSRLHSISRVVQGPIQNGRIERPAGEADRLESETVRTAEEQRTWVGTQNRIVVYDTNVPELPAPGSPVFPTGGLGDPRTLLERARNGDEKVVALGEATVRGIPVLQFRVGECRMTVREVGDGRSVTYRLPVVASVARDDYRPVRLEQVAACAGAPEPELGVRWSEAPRYRADYVAFETLEATAANRRLLEMRPHPGARVVDGEDVDAAEERAERRAPTPTPTPETD